MAEADIRAAFIAACKLDVAALKPGNVHHYADGHGMRAQDFLVSAEAAAPALCRSGAPLGQRLLDAVAATRAAVGCNTNLGILLLCAPLALAAERAPGMPSNDEEGASIRRLRRLLSTNGTNISASTNRPFALSSAKRVSKGPGASLSTAVAEVLGSLDRRDAALAYRAIARADPGGLGEAGEDDVRRPPRLGLVAAMALAAPRDRIAQLYADGFTDLFAFALPLLRERLDSGDDIETATTMLYLTLLARWPDSHLVRKFGDSAAQSVTREAAALLGRLRAAPTAQARHALLLDWDKSLKARGFNPGTSADLAVATLFAHGLLRLQEVLEGA